jgi:hypothetical protein
MAARRRAGPIAAAAGDGTVPALRALRGYLAEALDDQRVRHDADCPCKCGSPAGDGRVIASLSARLLDVLAALDRASGPGVDTPAADTPADVKVKARRDARRRSGTADA